MVCRPAPYRRQSPAMDALLEKTNPLLSERASRAHPDKRDLELLLLGQSGKEERMRVVRHLLKGCPECAAVTRLIWGFANKDGLNG